MELSKIKKQIKNVLKIRFNRNNNIITYIQAKDLIKQNSRAILLDVRSVQEYNEYHLDGAICVPTFELQSKLTNIIEDKNQTIIVYCQSGGRSKKAVNILKQMGYNNVYEIGGGIDNI